MNSVPGLRVRALNQHPPHAAGRYILYWMTANRRPHWNFSLDHAMWWAHKLDRPVLVLEALRCNYAWASDRLHRFVLQGMAANQARFAAAGVGYYPYVEPQLDAGKGLLAALAEDACVVVTDDYPSFFLPNMRQAAAARLTRRLEAVDSNGLLPLAAAERDYPTAYAFRRFLQQALPDHLLHMPQETPLHGARAVAGAQPATKILQRWPAATAATLAATPEVLSALPLDHSVGPAAFDGGCEAAASRCAAFLRDGLPRYAEQRSHPDEDAASGLSPYLHFGHISAHAVFAAVAKQEKWDITRLAATSRGAKAGWWGMGENAEAFLDELITWRELGYNMCWIRPAEYMRYDSLPPWAQQTLAEHAGDERPHLYSLEQLEAARTYDPVWNAAQTQLVREGRLQNYMRMVWGKKILQWTRTPQEALRVMIHLNDKYAVDGRDPNSYSGIFWVLGRYDRPWPRRDIFGVIRYMSSENTVKKLRAKKYLAKFTPA